MKSKVLVSLLIALVMLFTLAAPALAGKPTRGTLNAINTESGTAKYALQAAKDGSLKVTVTLIGAQPDYSYYAYVEWRWAGNLTADGTFGVGDIMTSSKGRGSIRYTKGGAYDPLLEYRVKVRFKNSPFTLRFISDWVGAP